MNKEPSTTNQNHEEAQAVGVPHPETLPDAGAAANLNEVLRELLKKREAKQNEK